MKFKHVKRSIQTVILLFTVACGEPTKTHKEVEFDEISDTSDVLQDQDTSMNYRYRPGWENIEPYQVKWFEYEPPEDYSILSLSLDTIMDLFLHHNYASKHSYRIPDYDEIHDYRNGSLTYYPADPWINDAIFQHEDMDIHIMNYPDVKDVLNQSFLFSTESRPHFRNGVFAITVLKEIDFYLCTQYFLTYDRNGKLIDQFEIAESHGEGGYFHDIEGYD